MKKFVKYFLVLLILAAIGAYTYWQIHKKQIIKDSLQSTVKTKTDSLYHIHYDSSNIDEINGDATFYDVTMKPDSLQEEMLKIQDSLPDILFNIHVSKVGALGVDVPGLLTKQTVSARIVYLQQPILELIQTGSDVSKSFSSADTLELYKQILGKFKSIRADTIRIINGSFSIVDKNGKVLTSMQGINVNLTNFLVDSAHDYSNIVSYFVKGVKVSVYEVRLPGEKQNTQIVLNKVEYDAAKKIIAIERVKQYNLTDNKVSIDLKKISIDNLNTDAFINKHQLKAGAINCGGGLLTITIKGKSTVKKGDPVIELSDDFFDEAQVDGVNLSDTKVVIIHEDKPQDEPLVLNNVKFNVLKKVNLYDGNTVSSLINNAQWQLSSDGFSFIAKKGIYKVYNVNVGNFTIKNTAEAGITVNHVQLKPLLSETAYGKLIGIQADLYNFDFNNIVLNNVNIHSLISDNKIEVETMTVQPFIRIFNDRTLPPDTSSRFGTYPHEALLKLKIPFFIKNLYVKNGLVLYREKSSSSTMIGKVFFTKINATISNLTNIPEKIKENPICTLNAKAKFLDTAKFTTLWTFPLDTKNGSFDISGHLDSMNGKSLNPTIKPLALMSIKEGEIDNLTFNVQGNDYNTTTNLSLIYHNMDFDILKKVDGENELKKKGLITFLANIIIRNDNTVDKERKIINQPYTRDLHKPFFYVVWQSIFSAAKNIALDKKTK